MRDARRLFWVLCLVALGCAQAGSGVGPWQRAGLATVVERASAARGLPVLEPVAAEAVSTDCLRQLIRDVIEAQLTGATLAAYQQSLETVGLWPPDRDLLQTYSTAYAGEIVGLYSPSQRRLFLVQDSDGPGIRPDAPEQEVTLAHEIVHALQHQHYPELMDPDPFWLSQDDAQAALDAALEGDASRFGLEAVSFIDSLPEPDEFWQNAELEGRLARNGPLSEVPALIQLTLTYPYAYGYRLSFREGAELLDAPPASTEQVLHPGQRHAAFAAIDLAPALAARPAACRTVFANTMGELQISVLLRDLSADGEVDAEAWEGWDGDRYAALLCGERRELAWLSSWDSEADAAQFAAAYNAVAAAVASRAELSGPPRAQQIQRDVVVLSPGLEALRDGFAERARRSRVRERAELRAHFEAGSAVPEMPPQTQESPATSCR
ncbi:MAG: hypothetical protein MJE66_01415 [Proteobacteria bacterium]|nr:hypothetical protein [Pseudomonadota bacterium]